MQELLKAIASGLVEKPEEVAVTSEEGENGMTVFHLHVAEDDMGCGQPQRQKDHGGDRLIVKPISKKGQCGQGREAPFACIKGVVP